MKKTEIRIPIVFKDEYGRLVNWLSGRFDVYQQDLLPRFLKVYFPTGDFSITEEFKLEYCAKITIKCKSKFFEEKIRNEIDDVVNTLMTYKTPTLETPNPNKFKSCK